MPDPNPLAQRLLQVAAEAVANENPFDLATGDSTPSRSELDLAEVVSVAVLRELAEMDRTVMGGDAFLSGDFETLADSIEKGGE